MAVSVQRALQHLREVERRRRLVADRRAAARRRLLAEAAARLRQRHGARAVRVFGSLVVGEPTPSSDVDLAVEGLEPRRYFAALADLMELFGGPVDLVRLEEAPPSLRRRIAEDGRTL